MRVFASYHKKAIADIIIPVPNINDDIVAKCLKHLKMSTPEPHNIILVESSGKDFCFGKSVNEGARNARTEVYILFNDDVFPSVNWLTSIVDAFKDYPNLAVCGAVQFDPDNGILTHLGGRFDPYSCIAYGLPGPTPNDPLVQEFLKVRTTPPIHGSQVMFSDWQNGGFFAVRKTAWDELGGMDTDFQLYWEDVDFCYRATRLGYDIGVHRGVYVAHHGSCTKNETGITTEVTRGVMIRKVDAMKRQGFNARDTIKEAKALFNVNQVESEVTSLAQIVYSLSPKVIVEIGTERGGTLFTWSRVAPEATLISIDWNAWDISPIIVSGNVHLINSDSHNALTVEKLRETLKGRPIDFLFIDGDHSYGGAKLDYEMYSQFVRPHGIIALHDICEHPPSTGCFVHNLWMELKRGKNYMEIIEKPDQKWAGIGVIFK